MKIHRLLSATAIALTLSTTGAFANDVRGTSDNGAQKCDVQPGSRDDRLAERHGDGAQASTGSLAIADGAQKCNVHITGKRSSNAATVKIPDLPIGEMLYYPGVPG